MMSRAFLSHSSIDKDFVRPIAELFGKDKCVFDEVTFEAAMKNIDEIFTNMDTTDIFVYFISNSSLNSEWVTMELNLAEKKLNFNTHKLKQIFPIIIDPKIQYSDERIADFLKKGPDSYNLRHVKNYKLAYKKILSQQFNLKMSRDSKFEERKNLFYGRDLEIKKFKDRYDDCSRNSMKCLVLSGMEGIGRHSFIREALKSAKIIKPYYFPTTVSLNRNDTIDDVIIKISDLGFGDYSIEDLAGINSMESKIDLLADLLIEVQNYNEHVVIYDDRCLINLDRNIKYWFEKALKKIKNQITISIATNVKLDYMRYIKNDDIFSIELEELQKSERAGLLRAYSELEEILFEREDIDFIQGSLTGYPPQIYYCVDLAKTYNVEYVKDHCDLVVKFSSQRASEALNIVVEDNRNISYGLLAFLSEYDNVPVKTINDIIKINPLYEPILRRFITLTICRYIGASNEYLKVNSVIQDYIQRSGIELPEDISNYLKQNIKEFNKNINDNQYTDYIHFSELTYYIKENLKNEKYVPKKFLYSTIYVRTVIELYNDKKNDRVIRITKSLKENGTFEMFDIVPKKQIQFYYCQSLAQKNSPEFNEEVEFFRENDYYVDYNFLKGFNYRLSGQLEKAENSLRNVLSRNGKHSKAKRELVIVYRLLDDYETAHHLAESNYIDDPENIYQMQAYFDCLIRKADLSPIQKEDINNILVNMKKNTTEKASEIYHQINALYQAYVIKDKPTAVSLLKEGLRKFNTSVYLAKDLFDIYEKIGDTEGMKEALEVLSKIIKDGRSRFESIFLCRQAMLDAYNGKSKVTIEVGLNRNNIVPENMKNRLLKKIDNIITKK